MAVIRTAGTAPAADRVLPIGYLRAFITLLVIAHHAFLAYHPYAPEVGASLAGSGIWAAFPIVDAARAPGVDAFTGFNDIFFMSLMFFVSGLFVRSSLARKGAGGFLVERAKRLGVPFVLGAALLAPLAYFPTYLQMSPAPSLAGFAQQWLALSFWPAGPAWFLWVLLAFGAVAALAQRFAPNWDARLAPLVAGADRRPRRFFLGLVAVSALAYLPLALYFGPMAWKSFGPFSVQIGRLLHYFVYFAAGAAIGAHGLDRGLLAADGELARRWKLWANLAPLAFFAAIAAFIAAISTPGGPGIGLEIVGHLTFVVSCAVSSLALVAIFVRFMQRPRASWDSLSANAFGMYVVHYAFVTWLQLALLSFAWSGWAKALTVFGVATAASWLTTAAARRLRASRSRTRDLDAQPALSSA